MREIVKNKYLDALLKLFIFSATIHIVILIIYSIIHLSITSLNFFEILQLNLIFPFLTNNLIIMIPATIAALDIYLFFLLAHKKPIN